MTESALALMMVVLVGAIAFYWADFVRVRRSVAERLERPFHDIRVRESKEIVGRVLMEVFEHQPTVPAVERDILIEQFKDGYEVVRESVRHGVELSLAEDESQVISGLQLVGNYGDAEETKELVNFVMSRWAENPRVSQYAEAAFRTLVEREAS